MEVGEVDTKPQFMSVKEAISLFSGNTFFENQSIMKPFSPHLLKRMMIKESEQHLVQKELYELKRQLKTANLSDKKTYSEERKVMEDINNKLLNLLASGELSSIGNVISDWIDVTKEESYLKNELDSLKWELQSLKKEHSKLMMEELLTGSICFSLKTQKLELNACLAEEFAARGQFDGLISALQEMLLETRDARKEEEEEMKLKTDELKKEAEAASSSLSHIENELRLALQVTEEAKSSEARILSQIKTLSEKVIPSTDARPESITEITIPEEEFEYLIQRIHETDTITEMKVAAAREQIKSAKASEHKALKKLERRKKQMEDMHAIIELATKRAQVADAMKKELWKRHKRVRNMSDSRTSSGTETKTYHLTKTSKHSVIAPQIKTKEQNTAGGCCLPKSHNHRR